MLLENPQRFNITDNYQPLQSFSEKCIQCYGILIFIANCLLLNQTISLTSLTLFVMDLFQCLLNWIIGRLLCCGNSKKSLTDTFKQPKDLYLALNRPVLQRIKQYILINDVIRTDDHDDKPYIFCQS